MKKSVKIIYGISLALVVFMLVFFHFHEDIEENIPREDDRITVLNDNNYEVTAYYDPSAPLEITQEYSWTLTDVPRRDGCLAFYTVHQEVEIYIEDELIYSLQASENNLLAKTTGCDWAKAFLHWQDEGSQIRVLIKPIYETSINREPEFYYGNFDTICMTIMAENVPVLFLGVAAIILGLMFIVFVLINIRSREMDKSLAMLGIFSVFAGLWKITDMSAAPLIFKDSITLSAVSLISVSMMVTPYIFFVRQQLSRKTYRIWDFLCIVPSISSIVIVFLQMFGVADLRETLSLCHAVITVTIIVIVGTLIKEATHQKLTARLQITIVCCLLCLAGTALDMVAYYHSGDSSNMIYCMFAFLIYIVLMGYMSVRETRQLIERGKEAKRYKELAMHDELTGLYSRAFYSDYLKKHNLQCKDCYIVMLDVNNLKQCNDGKGHACGDQLLKNSAAMIEHAFLPNGKCIRLGGDEFCVLLRDVTRAECERCLCLFDELLTRFNTTYPDEFPVNIAYGYANFDASQDYDFADTLRRADKMMYQMKIRMKTESKRAEEIYAFH